MCDRSQVGPGLPAEIASEKSGVGRQAHLGVYVDKFAAGKTAFLIKGYGRVYA
jgi:hypothetical protein